MSRYFLLAMILAVLIDRYCGEPRRYHPLVGFGTIAAQLEHILNRGRDLQRLWSGVLAWALLVIAILLSGLALPQQGVMGMVAATLVLYLCLGLQSLHDHMKPIARALRRDDIDTARILTSHIVSRDTSDMSPEDMCRAAIESTLENGNDAVIAPLFWFTVAGPVGCLVHRVVNTLDAMWGYHTPRYEYFGKLAARADDVMAWIPARITALSYALIGETGSAMDCWRTQSALLKSPNGGPCMSAGAGALNLRLGGPCRYHGVLQDKPWFGTDRTVTVDDIDRALSLVRSATIACIGVITVACMVAP